MFVLQQMENADAERDIYDELLTQAEIQGNINTVNGKPGDISSQVGTHVLVSVVHWWNHVPSPTVSNALNAAEQALMGGDEEKLYSALKAVGVQNLQPQNKGWYLKQLQGERENKEQVVHIKLYMATGSTVLFSTSSPPL